MIYAILATNFELQPTLLKSSKSPSTIEEMLLCIPLVELRRGKMTLSASWLVSLFGEECESGKVVCLGHWRLSIVKPIQVVSKGTVEHWNSIFLLIYINW